MLKNAMIIKRGYTTRLDTDDYKSQTKVDQFIRLDAKRLKQTYTVMMKQSL